MSAEGTLGAPPVAERGSSVRGPSTLRAAESRRGAAAAPVRQLGLTAILAIWAAAALPMGLLSWVIAPRVADHLAGPGALPKALMMCLSAGLVWQFVLVVALVGREQGTLRWPVVKDALWLRAPLDPKSGRRGGRVWLILPVLVVLLAAVQMAPGLPHPAGRDLGDFLGSDAGESLLSGGWGWFGLIAVMVTFNTVLGEELLFRGFLLPRMNRAFGRGDWLANGLLFTAYHLHVPWAMPSAFFDTFIVAYPSRRYRSALIGILLHSVESLIFLALALSLVLKG